MSLDLSQFVEDFALGIEAADARRPQNVNARSKQPYQPGIGPHTESQTVALVMDELVLAHPDRYRHHDQAVAYQDGSRQKCDLCIGTEPNWGWVVEVKMIRMLGDNGKPNDNLPTHIISPYPRHRSALTDCTKLLNSGLAGRKAIVMYGYDYSDWPMEPLVETFEVLAQRHVDLTSRVETDFSNLIHPVHQGGRVLGWEILN